MHDLRLAVRALRATPVVSTVAALSLALGIGANTAIFSLVNGLLLRTLPVPDPHQLVTISTDSAIQLGFNAGIGWNYPMWHALQTRTSVFGGALAWKPEALDLARAGEKELAQALITSGDFFSTLGVAPAAGRLFTPADDVRGGGPEGPVVVVSHDFWQRRFDGSPAVVGRTLTLERVPFRVIGVAPRGFTGPEVGKSFDIAIPLGAEPLYRGGRSTIDSPRNLMLFVMLRLKAQQSIAAATAALRAMQADMHGSLSMPRFAKEPFTLVPAAVGVDLPGSLRPRYERPLLAIFAIVALVLLVACANIANVLLARTTARHHEISVRLALGASRWRLGRQLLVECLVLAGIGAAGGWLLATLGTRAIVSQLSAAMDTSVDWRVLAFTGVVAVLAALLTGTGAAVRAMRATPMEALKQQGRGASGSRSRGVSSSLVIAQVALSLMLITAAGLFVRSFSQLSDVPMGFDKDHVLLGQLDASRTQVDPAARMDFYRRIIEAASAVPGVSHAAASTSTPLNMGLPGEVGIPGAPPGTASARVVLTNRVTPGWFAAYGTTIRAGRDFDARDTAVNAPAVILNDAFARLFFPGRSPLGETVSGRTVVGVVEDQVVSGGFKADGAQRSRRDAAPPTMYIPLAQAAGALERGDVTLSVRCADDPSRPVRGLAAALASVDPDLTFGFRTLAESLNASIAQDRLVALLSGFFGGLAVLLAALGLYGVTSYAVNRQRAEIGIRLALGATPGRVVRLVMSRVALLIAAGIAAGLGLSVWASTFVASLLYGLTPRDPITIGGAAVTLALVGVIAGAVPAYRASRIDPARTLRSN